ncbi:MAG TPA: DUF1476 domain-containing protein [Rhizomicrobium sp.]|jgi:hypothetical protein|nr:DUF1476 domain-containing protein [Rhizomicrobium sp.]
MTSGFEDREKNYEAKWAHDEDLRFRTVSRRNKLLGLWAADQLGLTGAAAESYVNELLALEVRGARDLDIVHKLHEDFVGQKIAVSEHAISRKMDELLAEAAEQVMRETKS